MKKILIISHHYPPEIGAASNRLKQITTHLLSQGYKVFVVTSKPNYPNPVMYRHFRDDANEENLRIFRTPIITGVQSDKLSRIINQLLFLFFSFFFSIWILFKHSIGGFVTTSPPFIINLNGLLIKSLTRRKWVMEVRDLWPDSILAVGKLTDSSSLFRILKKFELLFYKKADRIIVVTHSTKNLLMKQNVDGNKIEIVTNGIPSWIQYQPSKTPKKDNQEVNICYIGNLGLSQNLKVILDVANNLKQYKHVKFFFVGEGLAKKSLIQYKEQLNLDNVEFVDGIINKEGLSEWYTKTDIGIISLQDSPLFKTVIPSKLFEYAAFNTPILFIGEGEAANLIQTYNLGFSVSSDIPSITDQINEMLSKKDHYRINQDFIENYSWNHLIKKYLDAITFS